MDKKSWDELITLVCRQRLSHRRKVATISRNTLSIILLTADDKHDPECELPQTPAQRHTGDQPRGDDEPPRFRGPPGQQQHTQHTHQPPRHLPRGPRSGPNSGVVEATQRGDSNGDTAAVNSRTTRKQRRGGLSKWPAGSPGIQIMECDAEHSLHGGYDAE